MSVDTRTKRPHGTQPLIEQTVKRIVVLTLVGTALLASGCISREIRKVVYKRSGVEVILREHRSGFGFSTVERGFAHPAHISAQRLAHILGAIDIRGRERQLAGIRTALGSKQVEAASAALSVGLAKANPNQELAVRIITKTRQHGLFNRKHITSFVAYVEDELLYLHFSRVDWQIPEREKKTKLPEPRVGENPMKFTVQPSEGMYSEGRYAVSVDWQDPVFRRPLRTAAEDGDRRKRTILFEDENITERRRPAKVGGILSQLTPDQLRALADLEEQRQAGTVTEGQYRKLRRSILDAAGADPAAAD